MIRSREANDEINKAKNNLSNAINWLEQNNETKVSEQIYKIIIQLEKKQNC